MSAKESEARRVAALAAPPARPRSAALLPASSEPVPAPRSLLEAYELYLAAQRRRACAYEVLSRAFELLKRTRDPRSWPPAVAQATREMTAAGLASRAARVGMRDGGDAVTFEVCERAAGAEKARLEATLTLYALRIPRVLGVFAWCRGGAEAVRDADGYGPEGADPGAIGDEGSLLGGRAALDAACNCCAPGGDAERDGRRVADPSETEWREAAGEMTRVLQDSTETIQEADAEVREALADLRA